MARKKSNPITAFARGTCFTGNNDCTSFRMRDRSPQVSGNLKRTREKQAVPDYSQTQSYGVIVTNPGMLLTFED